MRYALVFAVLAIGLTAVADDDKEKKYTSKEDGFAIQFPAGAKVTKKEIPGPNGIPFKNISVGTEMVNYGVTVMVISDKVSDDIKAGNVRPKFLFDGGVKGLLTDASCKKVSEKDLEFGKDKLPAREVLLEKEGQFVRVQLILDAPKWYALAVGGQKDLVTGKDGTDFLKSFEILKPAKPEK